jgi:general secretion pathway protein I
MKSHCARGFTLIEVLLALVVFSVAFGLILETLGGSSRIVRVAGDVGHAALVAQNIMDQQGVGGPIKAGATSGKIDETYSYQLETKQVVPDDSVTPKTAAQLFELTLQVSWGAGANRRTETFRTQRGEFPKGQRY